MATLAETLPEIPLQRPHLSELPALIAATASGDSRSAGYGGVYGTFCISVAGLAFSPCGGRCRSGAGRGETLALRQAPLIRPRLRLGQLLPQGEKEKSTRRCRNTPTRRPLAGRTAGDPDCFAISPAFLPDNRATGSIERPGSKPLKGEVRVAPYEKYPCSGRTSRLPALSAAMASATAEAPAMVV